MAISAVSGTNNYSTLSNLSATSNRVQRPDSDGDGDAGRVGGSEGGRGAKFATALQQALADAGLNPTGDSTTSQDNAAQVQQALQSFAQNLFSALHAQHANNSNAPANSNSADSNSGSQASAGLRAARGGGGRLQADLQQLVQQLQSQTSNASSPATNGSASTTATGNTTSNSALNALQSSFSDLLNALGQGNSQTNLSQFLQQLASKLPGASSSGNLISTSA